MSETFIKIDSLQYGRPFVSKLWHDIRAVFFPRILAIIPATRYTCVFCHVYLLFIPKYMTIFLQTRIYMRTKKAHIYALMYRFSQG